MASVGFAHGLRASHISEVMASFARNSPVQSQPIRCSPTAVVWRDGQGIPLTGATAMYDKLIERASKRNVMLGIGAVVVLAVIAIWIAL